MNLSSPLLVTGAAGFIGARFIESCNQRDIPVISVDSLAHFAARPEHQDVDFGQKVDRENLFDWLKVHEPELRAIVHLGACSDTTQLDESYLRQVNVEYSQKLWNHATERKLPFIYASSAATYGGGELGYDDREDLIPRLRPLNPYGESKRLFDLWALEQEKAGHHPPRWAGFKFFNVYGFGERHKNKMASVVLHAFDQIRERGQVRLFKSHREDIAHGEQKRDFIYVDDVVDVLHFALSHSDLKRGIYNLGSGEARTFLDLVRATFSSLGHPEKIEFIDTPVAIRERYQYFTEANMERLKKAGYTRPFTSLEQGVRSYVERLKKHAKQ